MVDKAAVGARAVKAARIVPGVDSYLEKENLREIDKQVRNQLADLLNRERGHLEDSKRRFAGSGNLEPLDDLDRLARTMQRLADTIRHAAYGWSPVFDQASVDRQRLERVHAFDQSLEDTVLAVHAEVEKLSAAPASGLDEVLQQIARSLSILDDLVREREQILRAR